MKVSEHFHDYEFVPKVIHDRFGDNSVWFIDERIVGLCEWLRKFHGAPIIINDWYAGGKHDSRGFRPCTDTEGAQFSQHRTGRAVDVVVVGITPEYVRDTIRLNFEELHSKFGVTTIEKDTPTWVHIDLRWTGMGELFEVPYK